MENHNLNSWLKLGIETLNTAGFRGLKIKDLCHELNVTKGSFYHWFQSKRDYEMQLLGFWKQRFTQEFIDQAEQERTPKEKLARLGQQCIDGVMQGQRLEFEINAWSFQDDAVKAFVISVYQQRHQYLEKLLSDIYQDPKDVKRHALILYSLVIGVDFFYRPLSKEELTLIFADYL